MKACCMALFFVLSISLAFSQLHTKSKSLIDSTSLAMCTCLNETLTGLDEEVKALLTAVVTEPASGALQLQNYLAQAEPARAADVVSQLQKLGAPDSDVTQCLNRATQRVENLKYEMEGLTPAEQAQVMNDFSSREKIIDLLLQGMEQQQDCVFAVQFIKLGLELEKK